MTCANRGPEPAALHLLPTLWHRNSWAWGRQGRGLLAKGSDRSGGPRTIEVGARHPRTAAARLRAHRRRPPRAAVHGQRDQCRASFRGQQPLRLGEGRVPPRVVNGERGSRESERVGNQGRGLVFIHCCAGRAAGDSLSPERGDRMPDRPFGAVRRALRPASIGSGAVQPIPPQRRPDAEERLVARQATPACCGRGSSITTSSSTGCEGDPASRRRRAERLEGRNHDWRHLYARDVLSMPDKWEYPWFAAWDLGLPHAWRCAHRSRVREAAA